MKELRETVERRLVGVEVGDDYRVEVEVRRRRLDFSPDEAVEFAKLLADAAVEAQAMMRLHQAEAAARTMGNRLGSDLVGARVTENGVGEVAAAHAAARDCCELHTVFDGIARGDEVEVEVLQARHAAGWPPDGYPAGVKIRAQCGGWPAECSCTTSPLYDGARIVVGSCYLHGRGEIRGFGEVVECECCTHIDGSRLHTEPGCPVHDPKGGN